MKTPCTTEYYALTDPHTNDLVKYAKLVERADGSSEYHDVQLDMSGAPHLRWSFGVFSGSALQDGGASCKLP